MLGDPHGSQADSLAAFHYNEISPESVRYHTNLEGQMLASLVGVP